MNALLRSLRLGELFADPSVPGPTALVPALRRAADRLAVMEIVKAWSRGGTGREKYQPYQLL